MSASVSEKGIMFTPENIRAIREGRKTQTRRVITPQPYFDEKGYLWWNWSKYEGCARNEPIGAISDEWFNHCLYGHPGDRLWVRETWGVGSRPDPWGGYDGIEYRADEGFIDPEEKYPELNCNKVETPDGVSLGDYKHGWHPSIFMPRWASRITLEITDVRVQRVQDISEEDAKAEGVEETGCWQHPHGEDHTCICYRDGFRKLWDSINRKKHPFSQNPWVWVLEFKQI